MTAKQMRMRQVLLALYLEVPAEVAASVTRAVMDAVEELEEKRTSADVQAVKQSPEEGQKGER